MVTSEENTSQEQGILETPIQAAEPQDNYTTVQEAVVNSDTANTHTNSVCLARAAYLTHGQLKMVQLNATSCKGDIGVVTPTGDMFDILCDFPETLWSGSTQFKIILNWRTKPLTLPKGQLVGSVELADIVPEGDPL